MPMIASPPLLSFYAIADVYSLIAAIITPCLRCHADA